MRKKLIVVMAAIFLFVASRTIFADSKDRVITCPEIYQIQNSAQLSKEEKVKKLLPYLKKEECWGGALYMIRDIDYEQALRVAIKYFADPQTSKEKKISLGKTLLQEFKYSGIIPRYKEFLVGEIVNNIGDFLRRRENASESAVGHYAFIASGFWGYDSSLFEQFKDERVIPNLIKALNAPDEIYGSGKGCIRYPTSWQNRSTGRNVARQQIPVALAKLNAKDAIPALLKIFKSHHDYYLKENATYALGYLLEGKEKEDFRRLINRPFNHIYRFAFGKGLIEQQDMSGAVYIRLEKCQDNWGSALYEIKEKLSIFKDCKDMRLRNFYAEVLNCKIFRQLVSEGRAITEDATLIDSVDRNSKKYNLERVVRAYEDIVKGVLLNGFTDFAPILKEIGQQSWSPRIQDITQGFLKEIEKATSR